MEVKVHYWNQLRTAAGQADETVQLAPAATLRDLFHSLSCGREELRTLLLDASGEPQRWILVDRGGVMLRDAATPLADGDHFELMTHMSGG
jgi:molybdopterin converting factor small subunit